MTARASTASTQIRPSCSCIGQASCKHQRDNALDPGTSGAYPFSTGSVLAWVLKFFFHPSRRILSSKQKELCRKLWGRVRLSKLTLLPLFIGPLVLSRIGDLNCSSNLHMPSGLCSVLTLEFRYHLSGC